MSGISGDMTLGALLDAGVPLEVIRTAVQSVIHSVKIDSQAVIRCGFQALQAIVTVEHEHVHRHLSHIRQMINDSSLSAVIKQQSIGIFELIAQAEAEVHGCNREEVHFHEVGAADSIADIVGAVAGLNWLGIEAIYASPVPTGNGSITIAHGTVSVPAPATARLLIGVPLLSSDIQAELTTPTGAGLLKYYVKQFSAMPSMTIDKIGIGAGSRDFSQQANILRLVIGNTAESTVNQGQGPNQNQSDSVWQLETNIDNLSGELIGQAIEQLWKLKPLDVWTTPISMKKQRPGVTISMLCTENQIPLIENVLFTHTTTLGVRKWRLDRTILARQSCEIETPFGTIKGKQITGINHEIRIVPEYDDVCRLSAETGIPALKIYQSVNIYSTGE